ncbi:alpha/beta hydrolase [Methylotetracoccus oryzae]|uniref:alpha/beta hydrolase n=1 Tax=Methylotetracoccus oryzae TaxID=1919059 RepID=UPI00111B2C77|nr:alpha/beta fold hydrolase [Methylotetracoccus oryzae]
MTAELLDCLTVESGAPPAASVIWLHGLGADAHDFEPIVQELPLSRLGPTRFVFPNAPHRPVTINGGYVMRAWYDIAGADLGRSVDVAGVEASCREVARLVEREVAAGVAPERIILAGFSQGGVIALETAARYPARLAGVIALSTYLAQPDQLPLANAALPVFMGHGTEDPIVPFALGQNSRATLESRGYSVAWHSYPMPHSVCAREIADIGAWLIQRLAPPGPA